MSIENKELCLKLNKNWLPIGVFTVQKTIVDLVAGEAIYALDIEYAMDTDGKPDFSKVLSMTPLDWERWIMLPVRPWDLLIHSQHLTVRVPTVVVTKNCGIMPTIYFNGKPSKQGVWERDKGIDQYSGHALKRDEASLDHVIPKSRGGANSWDNVVLTSKNINFNKGSKLIEEMGLKLIREPKKPIPRPIASTIKKSKHVDWLPFLYHNQK